MNLTAEEKRLIEKIMASIDNLSPKISISGQERIYNPKGGKSVKLGRKANYIISEDTAL